MSRKILNSKGILFDSDDSLYDLLKSIKQNTDGGYYIETIESLHQTVHDKKMHTISYRKQDVGADGTLLVRIVATTKDIHANISFVGEGKTILNSYTGTTYTAAGTPYTPFNRQTAEVSNLVGDVYIDPTVDVLGTQRGDDFVGSSGAAARAGGASSPNVETLINAGTELLLIVTNASATASDLGVIANIYEREPIA